MEAWYSLRSYWRRHRWFRWLSSLLLFVLLFILFRGPILRGFAYGLISEDDPVQADVIVVLSGGALDRGTKALALYQEGLSDQIFCPGGNLSPDLEAMGMDILESEVTKKLLLDNGVPEAAIQVWPEGKSTQEEAQIVWDFAKAEGWEAIIVVSSRFHTRRVQGVYRRQFRKTDVEIIVVGAPSSSYSEMSWWQSENGLIALNNEYIKLVYYTLKFGW